MLFVLTGYAASPAHSAGAEKIAADLLLLFLAYSICLFGGCAAFNAAWDEEYDRSRGGGPLNFLDEPPVIPPGLAALGLALKILGALLLLWLRGPVAGALGAAALLLSVFYSARVPGARWRGKEIAGVDTAINCLGCGVVSVLLGYAVTGAPIDARVVGIAVAFTVTVLGSYPSTQVFQLRPDDTYGSARNFASRLGASRALRFGTLLLWSGWAIAAVVVLSTHPELGDHPWRALAYGAFTVFFLWAGLRSWQWSKAPWKDSHAQFKRMIATVLGARVFWILAEWSR
jgi:4-hydroxybenzoate polyprenyltransferase